MALQRLSGIFRHLNPPSPDPSPLAPSSIATFSTLGSQTNPGSPNLAHFPNSDTEFPINNPPSNNKSEMSSSRQTTTHPSIALLKDKAKINERDFLRSSLKSVVISALKLIDQGEVYFRSSDLDNSFISYTKGINLYLDVVRKHPDFGKPSMRRDLDLVEKLSSLEYRLTDSERTVGNIKASIEKRPTGTKSSTVLSSGSSYNAIPTTSSSSSIIRSAADLDFLARPTAISTTISASRSTDSNTPIDMKRATITPEKVLSYLERECIGILFIDVRPVQEYFAGHFRWRVKRSYSDTMRGGTINIDPAYLKSNIKSSELVKHLPAPYLDLFKARDKGQIIVYYDSRTATLPKHTDAQPLRYLFAALWELEIAPRIMPSMLLGGWEGMKRIFASLPDFERDKYIETGKGTGIEIVDEGGPTHQLDKGSAVALSTDDFLRERLNLLKMSSSAQNGASTNGSAYRPDFVSSYHDNIQKGNKENFPVTHQPAPLTTRTLSKSSSSATSPNSPTRRRFEDPSFGFNYMTSTGMGIRANDSTNLRLDAAADSVVYPNVANSHSLSPHSALPPITQMPPFSSAFSGPIAPTSLMNPFTSANLQLGYSPSNQPQQLIHHSVAPHQISSVHVQPLVPAPFIPPKVPAYKARSSSLTTINGVLQPSPPPSSSLAVRNPPPPRSSSPSPSGHSQTYFYNAPPPPVPPKFMHHSPSTISHSSSNEYMDEFGPLKGLRNLGNTCFLNSTLQCLSGIPPLSRFFYSGEYRKSINKLNPLGTKGVVAEAYGNLIRNLWTTDETVINPSRFKESVCIYAPQFKGSEQHDSQEFLAFLLDGLHEDLNSARRGKIPAEKDSDEDNEHIPDAILAERAWAKYLKYNSSFIVELFQGQLKNRMQCLTCGKTSTTFNTFMYLSLPIPLKSTANMVDCLSSFVAEETLEGSDAWHCPKCKQARKSKKILSLAKLPKILLVHLKRFYFSGPFRNKIDTLVEFPVRGLDLANFISPDLRRTGTPFQFPTGTDGRVSSSPSFTYDLYAVSNHYGGLNGGHYTAHVYNGYKQNWFYFDDTRVSQSNEHDAQSKAAYILIYVRRE